MEMEEQLDGMLEEAGVPADKRSFERFLDMRYQEQAWELSIPLGSKVFNEESFRLTSERFHRDHEREYCYSDKSIPLEIVYIRVFATGHLEKPRIKKYPLRGEDASPAKIDVREVHFLDSDKPVLTTIYDRDLLEAGNKFEGPAIVEQMDATTIIPPGMVVEVDKHLNLVIITNAKEGTKIGLPEATDQGKVDPILTEVMRNAFKWIVNEMASTLERAAMSATIQRARDFSASLCDGEGHLLICGELDAPAHVGTQHFTVQGILKVKGQGKPQPWERPVRREVGLSPHWLPLRGRLSDPDHLVQHLG